MDDFVTDEDRRSKSIERFLDNLNRAINTRAKSAGCAQLDREIWFASHEQQLGTGGRMRQGGLADSLGCKYRKYTGKRDRKPIPGDGILEMVV